MLGAATALAGIALRRLDPFSRERLLREIEPSVRDYIDKVNAAEARRRLALESADEQSCPRAS
jgi:hypothetical protein